MGPGTGNLTKHLLQRGARVTAVEKDDTLYGRLVEQYKLVSVGYEDGCVWQLLKGEFVTAKRECLLHPGAGAHTVLSMPSQQLWPSPVGSPHTLTDTLPELQCYTCTG